MTYFKRPMIVRICPDCIQEKLVSKYAVEHGTNLVCRSCASKRINAERRKSLRLVCMVDSCTNRFKGRGYCNKHLYRIRQHGSPEIVLRDTSGRTQEHPSRSSYLTMKQRCLNPKTPNYIHYGGRGIRICSRWLGVDGFANFCEDMGIRPTSKSLDRIDNNGDYEPGNCRWATRSEQNFNKRTKREIMEAKEIFYESKC